MGAFKEEAHFLEELQKQQGQIWNDSADYGISRTDMSAKKVGKLRAVIKDLLELPGSKVEWKANTPAIQRQYRLIIMWSGMYEGRCDATQYNVLYFKDRKNEFFSIDSFHVFTDNDGNPIAN